MLLGCTGALCIILLFFFRLSRKERRHSARFFHLERDGAAGRVFAVPDHKSRSEATPIEGIRCLVTGASGFVGSHLAQELVRQGAAVRALVRKTSNLQWLGGTDAEIVCGELRRPESLAAALEGVDHVFHVAGVIKATGPDAYFRVNAGGTASVLEACCGLNRKPKVVLVSSLAAGGPSGRGPALTEEDPPRPISFYGQSKVEAERVAARYFQRLPIAIVRPPVIYGPRETDVFQFIKAAARWRIAPIAGEFDTPLSLVHVQDVVAGLIAAARSPHSAGRTYYVAGPETVTWTTVADALEKVLGHRLLRFRVPMTVSRIAAVVAELTSAVTRRPALFSREKVREILADGWVCNIEKAQRELGFAPKIGIVEGMRTTIEWYRQQKWIK
jgi:nucleoside-diphosphate-sugar epimerase